MGCVVGQKPNKTSLNLKLQSLEPGYSVTDHLYNIGCQKLSEII